MNDTPRPPVARVLSVGDELVGGLTVDTNSAYVSRHLAGAGVPARLHQTVGDDQPLIEQAIRDNTPHCDLLVVTGGIGPTPDDLTREALAVVVGRPLVTHDAWLRHIAEIWTKRGRRMPESNRKQAAAPEGCDLLDNPVGTAAGVAATLGGCRVFVIPGVPTEARAMFERHVLPFALDLSARRGGRVLRARALHTFGLGESDLAERLGKVLERGHYDDADVGTTASRGVVSVRIYARGSDVDDACRVADAIDEEVRAALGDLVFGVDDDDLPAVVARALRDHPRQPILTLAESCTGGLVAKLVTDQPGSSAHFHRGFVTYSNSAKSDLLNVPRDMINEHGAVSEPVARAMADGVRAVEGHGVALAVTGIAGPGGGTENKPVGTVWIALATPDGTVTRRFVFHGDRDMVRLRAAYSGLSMLRAFLGGRDPLTFDKLP